MWNAELDALVPPHLLPPSRLLELEPSEELEVSLRKPRTLSARARKLLRALLLLGVVDTAMVMNREVEQPSPIDTTTTPYHFVSFSSEKTMLPLAIPRADEDIQSIIDALDTDEKYEFFVQANCKSAMPKTPWGFFGSYGYSPEAFQDNDWSGACNTFSEFACEVGERHGKHMYLVAMWPNGTRKHQSCTSVDEVKHKNSWHVVAAYKTQRKGDNEPHFVIFDNNKVIALEPGATLSEWADTQGFDIIEPVGGIIKWHRVADDCRAKIGRHMSISLSEEDMEVSPTVIQPIAIAQR